MVKFVIKNLNIWCSYDFLLYLLPIERRLALIGKKRYCRRATGSAHTLDPFYGQPPFRFIRMTASL